MCRRFALAALVAVSVGLAGSACGGSGPEPATESTAETAGAPASSARRAPDDDDVAGALELFVSAAGRGDVEAMWALLSEQSRTNLGPTVEGFAREYAEGFERGLGSFAGTDYAVVLSDVTPSGWGVAAIAGDRVRAGKTEYAAYAAMLAREEGGWRLVIGDPVQVTLLSPGEKTDERRPPIRFRVRAGSAVEEAGLWLDGKPVPGTVQGSGQSVQIAGVPETPLPPGQHVVVVFGRSGDNAAAGASPFVVQGGPTA